ncbi:MAG: monovalent cation/H+ antiporter subunit D family protein [Caldimicrobium sp.]|nr:monovalent cation/H+ antiporter subunit D family protein [Caldimicrobium sp.]MCX7873398.1 monovalent cation/H+ antiporter subunit D family protein [Caldimicrobium sp.]MDW8094376.1 monovalent cation/H+ antiporter subunit D family protein [Caldimicrobium sp.]
MSLEVQTSVLPLIAVLSSALAIPFIVWIGERNPNLREAVSVFAGIIKFIAVLSMVPSVISGKILECHIVTLLPNMDLKFRVDALGLVFALGASFLWILTTFYSIGYMRGHQEKKQTRYYSCFAGALSSTMGIAFASNLFTLFLFYEILTFTTYPLVAHHEDAEARAGGRKYVLYLVGSAKLFLIAAIVLVYLLTGTLEFRNGGIIEAQVLEKNKGLLNLLFIMFLYGFAKAAVMPLHGWLPAAMVAPTPVSALLHAVAVVKSGVFSVLRVILHIFGLESLKVLPATDIALLMCAFTITVGSIIALTRDNLKARLAYSTISQLSYIILGALLLTEEGILGGILHITNHAFAKITLFFCAGSLYVCAHKTLVSELDGIAKRLPITMVAFTIGALAMIGMPLFNGFISKWYLLVGAVEAQNLWILMILLLSSLLNAGYFLPIIYRAYFKDFPQGRFNKMHHTHHDIRENPFMAGVLLITSILTILTGIYPQPLISLVEVVLK